MPTKTAALALSLALIILGGFASFLHAQPAPVQQFQENERNRQQMESLLNSVTSSNAPQLYPGENQDVGPQRILNYKAAQTHFEGQADTQFAYTDNNRLDNHFRVSTAYSINTVQIAFAPTPYELGPGIFAPRIGFRSQWYNYGLGLHSGESALDFDGQTFFASGQYRWHDHWEFDAEMDYTRLLTQSDYDDFYSDFVPSLAVQRLFNVTGNLLFAVSLEEAYHVSRVPSVGGSFENVNDRLDSIAGLTATYKITDRFLAQPYYRFDHTYYPRTFADTKRSDFLHTVGLSVMYYFTQEFSVRAYASESFRGSDDPNTPYYSQFNPGVGLNFTIRF
jgi:hypothetical protein